MHYCTSLGKAGSCEILIRAHFTHLTGRNQQTAALLVKTGLSAFTQISSLSVGSGRQEFGIRCAAAGWTIPVIKAQRA